MKQLNIKKMTQKFEKDDEKPANEQIRKTVFNLDQQRIYIHYHYANGQIFSDPNEYNRDELRGDNQLDVNEDKNEVDGKKSQQNASILKIEQDCLQEIKDQEKAALGESTARQENEKNI